MIFLVCHENRKNFAVAKGWSSKQQNQIFDNQIRRGPNLKASSIDTYDLAHLSKFRPLNCLDSCSPKWPYRKIFRTLDYSHYSSIMILYLILNYHISIFLATSFLVGWCMLFVFFPTHCRIFVPCQVQWTAQWKVRSVLWKSGQGGEAFAAKCPSKAKHRDTNTWGNTCPTFARLDPAKNAT